MRTGFLAGLALDASECRGHFGGACSRDGVFGYVYSAGYSSSDRRSCRRDWPSVEWARGDGGLSGVAVLREVGSVGRTLVYREIVSIPGLRPHSLARSGAVRLRSSGAGGG